MLNFFLIGEQNASSKVISMVAYSYLFAKDVLSKGNLLRRGDSRSSAKNDNHYYTIYFLATLFSARVATGNWINTRTTKT